MSDRERFRVSLVGALLSSVGALAVSICCLPIALAALGAASGIASTLGPFRPLFLASSLFFLAVAFYSTYRPERFCGEGHACRKPGWFQKFVLWMLALGVLGLMTIQYWASWLIYWML